MSRNINRTIYTLQNLHIYDKAKGQKEMRSREITIKKHNEAFKTCDVETYRNRGRSGKKIQ